MISRSKISGCAALLAVQFFSPGSGIAQPRVDIIQIYGHFVAAGAAANQCGMTGEGDRRKWLANLYAVTIRAMLAVKERTSGMNEAVVLARFNRTMDRLAKTVVADAQRSKCASPRIRQLLQLYKLQTTMTLV